MSKLPTRIWAATLILVPIFTLVWSWRTEPYFTDADINLNPSNGGGVSEYLGRLGRTKFYVTSEDLLQRGKESASSQVAAIVFDTFASGEGVSYQTDDLSWVKLAYDSIRWEGKTSFDLVLANKFLEQYSGSPSLPRGTAKVFWLPPESSFRQATGLLAIAALAVRNSVPREDLTPPSTPQLLQKAVQEAFSEFQRNGITTVGVPRIMAYTTTSGSLSTARSWTILLPILESAARTSRMTKVVIGTWALHPKSRELYSAGLLTAWNELAPSLNTRSKLITHAPIRLWAVICLASILRWSTNSTELNSKRALALGMVAYGISLGIEASIEAIGRYTIVDGSTLLAGSCLAAIFAGALIQKLSQFKATDHL